MRTATACMNTVGCCAIMGVAVWAMAGRDALSPRYVC